MIYIQETTADERGLIADAVCPIVDAVEKALGDLSGIGSGPLHLHQYHTPLLRGIKGAV